MQPLYQLPAKAVFIIEGHESEGTFVYGGRIDGMYGSCRHAETQELVFLAALTPTVMQA